MNQPSAEDVYQIYFKHNGGAMDSIQAILDRYHLIDKTEPVSGVVTAAELLDLVKGGKYTEVIVKTIHDTFDVYPKGTVSRLEGEAEKMCEEWSKKQNECNKLQAEVDRLKEQLEIGKTNFNAKVETIHKLHGEIDQLKEIIKIAESQKTALSKKPEAVGCGKYKPLVGWGWGTCGEYGKCIDCQAKERIATTEQRIEKVLQKTEAVGCGGSGIVRIEESIPKEYAQKLGKCSGCHDCQAKAKVSTVSDWLNLGKTPIEQVGRAYKRVELPEVPENMNYNELEWSLKVEKFLQAVKDRLEEME